MDRTGSESSLPSSETTPKQLDGSIATHTKSDHQEICVICLEPVSERAVAVPCNHCSFDFICAASWLQECSLCPLCKVEVTALEYDWRSPDDYQTFYVDKTERASPPRPARSNHYRNFNRRRRRTDGDTVGLTERAAISRRRYVYRHQLFSLHVGANRVSQFRNFTPKTFASSSTLQSRARKWIRRELGVFDFLYSGTPTSSAVDRRANNAEFLLEYIIAILKSVEIKGSSGQTVAMLQDFICKENATLFLHELEAWLRSPYISLEDWDLHVQYRETLPLSLDEDEYSGVTAHEDRPK